ncbi:MAG: hypothetical protein ACT4PS_08735 [Betaproteobacteria bacterium]
MRYYDFSVAVGASQRLQVKGNFCRFYDISAGAASPTIKIKAGRPGSEFLLKPGQMIRLPESVAEWYVENFDALLTITGKLLIGEGDFQDNNFTGNVSVSTTPAAVGDAHTQAGVAISNTSAVIIAANSARKYLLIQNQDSANDLYIATDGGAASTDANCIKLEPGEAYEPLVAPTGEVRGIMSAASAGTNVHVIEA